MVSFFSNSTHFDRGHATSFKRGAQLSILAAILALAGCSGGSNSDDEQSSQTEPTTSGPVQTAGGGSGNPQQTSSQPVGSQPISGDPSSPAAASTVGNNQAQFGLAQDVYIMTPEQYSKHVHSAFDLQLGWTNARGEFVDAILALYNLPLGGVDFETSLTRETTPNVQKLLALRSINWQVAAEVVYRETRPENPETVIFTDANVLEDRPYGLSLDPNLPASLQADIQAGEARWRTQLESIYWRMFSRPPTPDEVNAIRSHFLLILEREPYPPIAWMTVIYSLLSTAEWWNP